ncbi:hypothetical protein [Citrobacter koseri]|uniref:hypothetical protein n=1 Tax=Citrobacter koseri TaxID=545 RepID=UPI0038919FAF
MKIIIPYSSKWSAELADALTHEAKFVSMDGLSKISRGSDVVLNEDDTYETVMEKINSVYRTVSKSTVLGVLARLLGEVRYLDLALQEDGHIINRLADKVSFTLHDRELYNEIVALSRPATEVQGSGGGLVSKSKSNFLLLGDNVYSRLIYAVYGLRTLNDIKVFLDLIETKPAVEQVNSFLKENGFAYTGSIELSKFITEHKEHAALFAAIDKRFVKYKKQELSKVNGEAVSGEVVELDDELKLYKNLLDRIARFTEKNLDKNEEFNAYAKLGQDNEKNAAAVINITGLLYYAVVSWLDKIGLKNEIDGVLMNKNGNLPGIASNSGKITEKDFYKYVSLPKLSWSMPYMIDTKFLNKKAAKQFNQNTTLGIGKECGVLEINVDVSEEEELALRERIRSVAVSTFSVGKKGLAYVKEIVINE